MKKIGIDGFIKWSHIIKQDEIIAHSLRENQLKGRYLRKWISKIGHIYMAREENAERFRNYCIKKEFWEALKNVILFIKL